MKKILTLILLFAASLVLITPTSSVKADAVETIPIIISREGNQIRINQTSSIDITEAVVEYAFYDANQVKISMLATYEVSNNRFTVDGSVIAVKVHQVKSTVDRTTYVYNTTNQNSIGDFSSVTRQKITHIQTVHSNTVNTNLFTAPTGSNRYNIFEFYFNFSEEHDLIRYVNVHYVIEKTKWLGLVVAETYNELEKVTPGSRTLTGYVPLNTGSAYRVLANQSYQKLESNTDAKVKADYVVRLAPDKYNDMSNHRLNNFAIIEIAVEHEGEFIVYDVINPPYDPDNTGNVDDWINQITNFFDRMTNFINRISDFFSSNSSTLLKVGVVILALIAYAILSPVIKLLWNALKLIFDLIVKILAKIFGVFF